MIDTAKTITVTELAQAALATAPERFEAIIIADPEKAAEMLVAIMVQGATEAGLTIVA